MLFKLLGDLFDVAAACFCYFILGLIACLLWAYFFGAPF